VDTTVQRAQQTGISIHVPKELTATMAPVTSRYSNAAAVEQATIALSLHLLLQTWQITDVSMDTTTM